MDSGVYAVVYIIFYHLATGVGSKEINTSKNKEEKGCSYNDK